MPWMKRALLFRREELPPRHLLSRVEGNVYLNVILSCCSAPVTVTTLLGLYVQSYLNFLKKKTRSNSGEGIAVIPLNLSRWQRSPKFTQPSLLKKLTHAQLLLYQNIKIFHCKAAFQTISSKLLSLQLPEELSIAWCWWRFEWQTWGAGWSWKVCFLSPCVINNITGEARKMSYSVDHTSLQEKVEVHEENW